jgi:hypothetical protein
MDVNWPADLPADEAAAIKATEKAYSQELQRSGKWPEIWRVVGEYANYSIFDVIRTNFADPAEPAAVPTWISWCLASTLRRQVQAQEAV